MKGITLCAECAYYSMKKHKCTRGATDEGEPTARFYADCPLDDAVPVVHGHLFDPVMEEIRIEWGECSNCGGINDMDAKYCNWCGAILDGGVEDE